MTTRTLPHFLTALLKQAQRNFARTGDDRHRLIAAALTARLWRYVHKSTAGGQR